MSQYYISLTRPYNVREKYLSPFGCFLESCLDMFLPVDSEAHTLAMLGIHSWCGSGSCPPVPITVYLLGGFSVTMLHGIKLIPAWPGFVSNIGSLTALSILISNIYSGGSYYVSAK